MFCAQSDKHICRMGNSGGDGLSVSAQQCLRLPGEDFVEGMVVTILASEDRETFTLGKIGPPEDVPTSWARALNHHCAFTASMRRPQRMRAKDTIPVGADEYATTMIAAS